MVLAKQPHYSNRVILQGTKICLNIFNREGGYQLRVAWKHIVHILKKQRGNLKFPQSTGSISLYNTFILLFSIRCSPFQCYLRKPQPNPTQPHLHIYLYYPSFSPPSSLPYSCPPVGTFHAGFPSYWTCHLFSSLPRE